METCKWCGLLISHNGDGVWRDGDGYALYVGEFNDVHIHTPLMED